jgi:hypothetical protein
VLYSTLMPCYLCSGRGRAVWHSQSGWSAKAGRFPAPRTSCVSTAWK